MSLQNNLQQGNPFEEGDKMGRDVLWNWLNDGQKTDEILENPELYDAIEQFNWFPPLQQESFYPKLNLKKIRELTKYLKEPRYNKI